MILRRLYLHHFRNYTETEISFLPGVNWITGPNAQGKTNLLEAIYLLSTGRSFRTAKLAQLIQKDASYFFLEAEIEKDGVRQSLQLSFDGETKKLSFNASQYTHFTPLIGLLPHILYAPEDISLVVGTPSYRRKFLDIHLSQVDPLYLRHLARFHKAMRQRNELLKNKSEVAIEPWEEMMSLSAVYLMEKREQLIKNLRPSLQNHVKTLSGEKDHLEIVYEHSLPKIKASELIDFWKKSRRKDLYIGATLQGPHRDDLQFLIDGSTAKSIASEGQKHTIVASLRLAQAEHLKAQVQEKPLISVDDFGSHLDQDRQGHFQEKLLEQGQIFLTSPTALESIFPGKQIIRIGSGQVFEVSGA